MYVALRGLAAFILILGLNAVAHAEGFPTQSEDVPWPTKAWPEVAPDEPVRVAVEAALAKVFKEDAPEFFHGGRGIVVIYKGRLVGEAYRDGYDRDSRFVSWSEAKSVTQALVGIAVHQGLVDVEAPAGFAEWADDPRSAITLDDLLRMSSGLEFVEGAAGLDDNTKMMFGEGHLDQAAYAASRPLIHEPGTHWAYATGTTMMVSRVVRDAVTEPGEEAGEAYLSFIEDELLKPLGMKSAVPEFDVAGTFLGGTSFFASTRDYARFGLLYLRDGMWDGSRILPEGWADYSRSVTPHSSGLYGTHFWLGPVGSLNSNSDGGYVFPPDMFQARGMGGQFIAIVPSEDLVLAYNGYSAARDYGPFDMLLADVLAALADHQPED